MRGAVAAADGLSLAEMPAAEALDIVRGALVAHYRPAVGQVDGWGRLTRDLRGALQQVQKSAHVAPKEMSMTMQTNGPDPRQQQQRQEREHPRTVRARKIRETFRSRWRELCALFPRGDAGEAQVTRAQALAVQVSLGMDDKVTAQSIAEAAVACLHLGLDVGDQAYIYPYGSAAKLTVGPRGLIALAYRSGFVADIEARSVFRADVEQGLFDYDLGEKWIKHKKATEGRRPQEKDDRGNWVQVAPERLITHAYVTITTKTEGKILEVLTAEDIAFYRGFSKARRDDNPWIVNYEGMCRKTAVKRGLEFVPRSPLLSAALREQEDGSYEVPEELLVAARSKGGLDVPADMAPPEPAEAPVTEERRA